MLLSFTSTFRRISISWKYWHPSTDNINSCRYSIIELSSFQLEKMKEIKLDLGVLLNISPDHIDHHGNFAEYKRAKNRIKESKKVTQESDPAKLWSIIVGKPQSAVQDIELKDLPHRYQRIKTPNQMVSSMILRLLI